MAVPLVLTQPASEFGELTSAPDFNDPFLMDRDMSYVPGFSDLRRARDMKIAEYTNHKCQLSDIPSLPVNMRWGRNQNKAGQPDSTKIVGHSVKGYRPAKASDISPTNPWLTAMPPGAHELADGTIAKGDTILLVATKERAAQNARLKAEATKRRVTGMEHSFAAIANKDQAGWKGADPTVKKEVLSPITAPVATATGKQ